MLALGVALLVAGCGSADQPNSDTASTPANTPSATELTAPPESPADDPVDFPGGVTARIVGVEASPAEASVAEEMPEHDTLLRVTVKLSTGPDGYALNPEPLGAGGPNGELLYGPNQLAAPRRAVEQQIPPRVTEDSPVVLIEEFSLPASGLSELVFVYTPDAESEVPWTFTGVEELLG
jgi:hypothetical protein